ncbi:hypothetical protein RchiOBHm_Chr7g0211441 [Rosa chinensis]|uniref:Uncharacterized protein n=1 Tax=Rosa chinensis TaxID=74649 RepID=A0A2P6PAG1_ROSCH|nr:hypothetical protein RchiOBHm_Chr7g0211441 [Rosa chinensis]
MSSFPVVEHNVLFKVKDNTNPSKVNSCSDPPRPSIVLSHLGSGSDKENLSLFIWDLFTRLQIGCIEFKKKALESQLQLLEDDDKAACSTRPSMGFNRQL